MSRNGKKPVVLPAGVTATLNDQTVTVKGPKGELSFTVPDIVAVEQGPAGVSVSPREQSKRGASMWGLSRSMIANLVEGVSKGYEKKLEINGVGYRAAVQGKELSLALGFSHDVKYPIPADIDIKCPKPTEIVVSGIDKQKVGQIAAEIREFRPPEPYKGKGVKYAAETIVRKEGKKK